ncbi:MAG: hypothetical protein M1325_05090 [Actinobacteria bacterium]|nr:hypothetical protein [Actinomycetota bacterium]
MEVSDPHARAHEIEELKFLVGTSCSRAINLLTQEGADPRALQEEMEFLGTRATRLAELLRVSAG